MVALDRSVAEEKPTSTEDTARPAECGPGREGVSSPVSSTAPRGPEAFPSAPAPKSPERLAVALHDISNSLTVVLGLLEAAERGDGDEVREALASAIQRTRQAHRVARRAIGAAVPVDSVRVLAEVVEQAVDGLVHPARERGATLDSQLFPELRTAEIADADALSQVLTNLLLNAIQHAQPGDRIRVVGDTGQPGQALLSITDDGPGVPDEIRPRLFSERVTAREGGAGIGLQHAADLCRAAGGSIRLVPSQRGAHFAVTWPYTPGGYASRGTSRPTAPDGTWMAQSPLAGSTFPPASGTLTSMRLLLVEDDPAIAEMLKSALQARGATVRLVTRRRDIDAALNEAEYHGVLLDLSPIADDVRGVLAAVHAKNPDARLLLISGSVEGLPILSPDIVITWVQKPFELEDVVRALTAPAVVARTGSDRG